MSPLPQDLLIFIDRVNTYIINPIILFLMALALLLFVWGGARFLLNADNPQERERGKKHLLWGIVGLFVMLSVYFILQVALNTFGIRKGVDYPSEIPL